MGQKLNSRVVVLGLSGAGKSSFIMRMKYPNQIPQPSPTATHDQYFIDYKGILFDVWDVCGTDVGISLWKNYYSGGGCDAVIWVVDSSSKEDVKRSQQVLQSTLLDIPLQGVMLFVVANKQDVEGALRVEKIVKLLRLQNYDGKRLWRCVGTSALTGEGVKDLRRVLASDMKARLTGKAPPPTGSAPTEEAEKCACWMCPCLCGGGPQYA